MKGVLWKVAKNLPYIQDARWLNVNIFIYFCSLHVSGIQAPNIRRKLLYVCDTGICHSVWVASGLLVGLRPAATRTE